MREMGVDPPFRAHEHRGLTLGKSVCANSVTNSEKTSPSVLKKRLVQSHVLGVNSSYHEPSYPTPHSEGFVMRATYTLGLACAAICCIASLPTAHAVETSGLSVAEANSVMLSSRDATKLGISKQRVQTLTATTSNTSPVDDIWLCDLSGDTEIDIPGTRSLARSVARSQSAGPLGLAVHEFHMFPSAKAAQQAYANIVRKARSCTGTHTPGADVDMSEMPSTTNKTTTLTNGVKKAPDGDRFVWIESQTTKPDAATGYAENSYRTLRRTGSIIQVVYVENDGENVTPLSKRVLTAADELTDTLGDRLQDR